MAEYVYRCIQCRSPYLTKEQRDYGDRICSRCVWENAAAAADQRESA